MDAQRLTGIRHDRAEVTVVNSRTKGIQQGEQPAARYFKSQGPPWQDARRSVAAGWSNATTEFQDTGDLTGLPGLCVQVKALKKPLVGKELADVFAETERQAAASGPGVVPLILEKRAGTTDVGRWWLWLTSDVYVRLVTDRWVWLPEPHLVRVELGAVIGDLRSFSIEQVG